MFLGRKCIADYLVPMVNTVTMATKELCTKSTYECILSSYLAQIFFVTICVNE